VVLQNGQVLLQAEGMDNLDIEQTIMPRKIDLFEDAYGLRLRLVPVPARR